MAQSVLLADDSTNVHRLVRETLEAEGMTVLCVDNGEDALRNAVATPPDLVLADVTMPRLGGLELCGRMRLEQKLKSVPVIFLVGPFDEFDEELARKVGGYGQLAKPINPLRLATMVKDALIRGPAVTVSIEDDDEATILDQVSEVPEPEGVLRGRFQTGGESLHELAEISELQEFSELSELSLDSLKPDDGVQAEAPAAEKPLFPPLRPESLELSAPRAAEPTLPPASEEAMRELLERAVRTRVVQAIHPSLIQEVLKDVITALVREEVLRVLPGLVREAVDARIAELEKQVHSLESGA